jgi:uncharacterized protein YllA (UPF0747 family)
MAKQWADLGFELNELFQSLIPLEAQFVKTHTHNDLSLLTSINALETLYLSIKEQVEKVDATLGVHTINLSIQSAKKLVELEKKILKAEKRKQATSLERIHHIKHSLFPENSLQERVENFAEWVGDYGWAWVEAILQDSNAMEQSFTIISIQE